MGRRILRSTDDPSRVRGASVNRHVVAGSIGLRRWPVTGRARCLAGVLLTVFVLMAAGCSSGQVEGFERVNAARTASGLGRLEPSPVLFWHAQQHAEVLAARDPTRLSLVHSDLTPLTGFGFALVGETVGRGPSLAEVHQEFLRSEPHHRILLDPRFTHVGVGWALGFDRVHVVYVFG